jgi:hypothetical protein
MDATLKKLDAAVHLSVTDKDLNTPPGSPANGARYIVGPSPTGAWAGHAKDVAVFDVSSWIFYTPKTGWICWVDDEERIYVFEDAGWSLYAPGNAPGATRRLWIPHSEFESGTHSKTTPADNGQAEYVSLIAAGDTRIGGYFPTPDDYGATTSWKMYYTMFGSSTTTLTLHWGFLPLVASGDFVDALVTLNTLSLTPFGSSSKRLNIATLSTPAQALTPGQINKIFLDRINASDANNDDMGLLGFLLTYTVA